MDVNFQCTKCGDCCRGFRLPLSVNEAVDWLRDGHAVEVLCDAIPWVAEPSEHDLTAKFKRERSFGAMSGALPIRVLVTLVAPLGSGCPNLSTNNECSIYARRPMGCRAYPAESNPFLVLKPAGRRCPEEAWSAAAPPFMRQGQYVDPELRALISRRQRQAVDDVPKLAWMCRQLGLAKAAMANEGYAAHQPRQEDLLDALSSEAGVAPAPAQWEFVSGTAATIQAIVASEGRCLHESELRESGVSYLSLFARPPRTAGPASN
ncbi:MAG: YkgJ family cysteine cluster protein [Pelomonas sp.]|nr:YkgJ family cysteine cluster protein [Roseateles sp.]